MRWAVLDTVQVREILVRSRDLLGIPMPPAADLERLFDTHTPIWEVDDYRNGSHWPNAFTGNARMIAVESGATRNGKWVSDQRNAHADYKQLFGEYPGHVDAVAIMTDIDNTGMAATA